MSTVAAALLVALLGAPTAPTVSRVALVVGNQRYVGQPPLKNCVNDARAMATALSRLGFEVRMLADATRPELVSGLAWLGDKVRTAELGVFYYSGHGVQVNGENYLLPVEVSIAEGNLESQLRLQGINANEAADSLFESGCKTSVVILDACRDSPLKSSKKGTAHRGLAQMTAAEGSLVAFAADAGQTADDNPTGSNGLYTSELLKHLTTPGLTIEQVFKRTRRGVVERSGHKQIPAEYSRLLDDEYFSAPAEMLRTKAEAGDTSAMRALARAYFTGRGIEKDIARGMTWGRKAAEAGNHTAQLNLAKLLEGGHPDVPKNEAEAVQWYRKAAEAGEADAMRALAGMLASGRGCKRDDVESVRWYRKAADLGHLGAQVNLGYHLEKGRGCPKDEAEAARWYRKAAERGEPHAQLNLALLLDSGRGVRKDPAEAQSWYRKAATKGVNGAKAVVVRRKVGNGR